MQDLHFVYVIDCGHYDAEGYPIRVFGRSTLKAFVWRLLNYNANSRVFPILCGAIPCKDKKDALSVEKAILSRLWKDIYPDRERSEVRRGSEDVLEFIANEMEDGEEFLGMTSHEYTLAMKRKHYQRPDVKSKTQKYARDYARNTWNSKRPSPQKDRRAYQHEYRNRPDKRERKRQQAIEYRQRPEIQEKNRKYNRRPDVKERRRKSAQARKLQNVKSGKQLTLF